MSDSPGGSIHRPGIVRIGQWQVDPELDELSREGRTVRLEPRTMRVLLCLAEHAGRVVDVQKLLDEIWPNVVVTPGSVYQAIATLRRVLGDDSEHPAYIENLPRRGYRLIAPVERSAARGQEATPGIPEPKRDASAATAPAAAGDASVAGDAPVTGTPSRRRRATIAAAIGALVLAAIAISWVLRTRSLHQSAQAEQRTAVVAAVDPNSIAVLPFADMSEKKDQEYFADGLAEELLNVLAQTPGLHVIARTSSFAFKGKAEDIPSIAGKLRVANILEGSVRTSGNRLRVTTQLVEAADGKHLWSQSYDREMKDVFAVQDEIAAAVVSALKLKLAAGSATPPSRSGNVDAYLQYLLGQQEFSRGDDEGYRRSIAAYRQAIALDPQYASAYAALSLAEYYLADDTGDGAGLERAMAAAERAVALAPNQPMGYAARGNLRSGIAWDWAGARMDFARALELDPRDPIVLRRYSILLQELGELPESIAVARKVTELDPFSSEAWRTLGDALFTSGDLRAAREAIQRSLTIDPSNPNAIADLGTVELLDHRPAAALAAFSRIASDDVGTQANRLTNIAMAQHSLDRERESRAALEEAIAKGARVVAYQIAQAYAWRGEKDQAFEWLDRADRQRDGGLAQGLKTDPLIASLRADPRYRALLQRLKLPQ